MEYHQKVIDLRKYVGKIINTKSFQNVCSKFHISERPVHKGMIMFWQELAGPLNQGPLLSDKLAELIGGVTLLDIW